MEAIPQAQAPDTPADEHRPAEGSPEAYDDGEAAHDEPTQDEPVGRRERETYGLQIPIARIKRAMKDATDVKAVSAEASYLVARATELLLEHLTSSSVEHMQAAQRSELSYGDVDIVPQQVTIASLLQQVQREDALDLANGVSHAPLDAAAMQEDAQLAVEAEAPVAAAERPAPTAEPPAAALDDRAAGAAASAHAPAYTPGAVPAADSRAPAPPTQLAGVASGGDAVRTEGSVGVAPAGPGPLHPDPGAAPMSGLSPAAAPAAALAAPSGAPTGALTEGTQVASAIAAGAQDVPVAEAVPLHSPPMQMY